MVITKFTEVKLEQAILSLLNEENYSYYLGESITREQSEVLIKEDFLSYLLKKYSKEKITSSEIKSIIRTLPILPSSDLYDSNKTIMKMVSGGFSPKGAY